VLAGGETQETGQVLTIGEAVDVAHCADRGQGIADTRARLIREGLDPG
jgi:hypothetical protein